MKRSFRSLVWIFAASGVALAALPAHADALYAVRVLREGGCGGTVPPAPPLHRNGLLDRSAAEWAAGRGLSEAVELSGYRPTSAAGLHVRGPDEAMVQLLKHAGCRTLANQGLHEMGMYRRGFDTWIVLATAHEVTADARSSGPSGEASVLHEAPPTRETSVPHGTSVPHEGSVARAAPPALSTAPGEIPASASAPSHSANSTPPPPPARNSALSPILTTRALQLINNVRARGTRCGGEVFGPAPPVVLSATLAGVAFSHASDMAANHYFEHRDLQGNTPSDRVRATGYREMLVGENIAYGPKSLDDVVEGWLASPGHCENIMDPRFAEMGLGYATTNDSKHTVYWVQVLAKPRSQRAT